MDMRFGTWKVRSLHRSGSLKTVSGELVKYKLDLVGVEKVRWDTGGIEPAGDYNLFYGNGNDDHHIGIGFFVHKSIISAVKRVEFVSDGMSYIILRGRWCAIIFLNVHAPTEDKCDVTKKSFYEELEGVFDQFQNYHMKILLGDFNAKMEREDIFKPTIGNESLHGNNNDDGITVVNLATSKNLVVKSTMFPHCKIYKYTWTSPDVKTHNQIYHDRRQQSSILDVRNLEELTVIRTTIWWPKNLGRGCR
jgi:exonuclease III